LIRIQEARRQGSEPAEAEPAVPTLDQAAKELGRGRTTILRYFDENGGCPLGRPSKPGSATVFLPRGLKLKTVHREDVNAIKKLQNRDKQWFVPLFQARQVLGLRTSGLVGKTTLERKEFEEIGGKLQRELFPIRVWEKNRSQVKSGEHYNGQQILTI